jgi:hypothetical protein
LSAGAQPGTPLLLDGRTATSDAVRQVSALANDLGSNPIVLPGFAPIVTNGTRFTLGPRTYEWRNGYFPVRMDSLSTPMAGPMNLRMTVGGRVFLATGATVRVTEAYGHHVVVVAEGTPTPGLRVRTETRVEFDGMAWVKLTITPTAPVDIGRIDYEVDVLANVHTRTLRFATSDIRVQRRDQRIEAAYRGPFLNALGIADGRRSFWWFADNARGWRAAGDVTELAPVASNRVRLRQRLLEGPQRLSQAMNVEFGFLLTPVREMGSSWRADRITAGVSAAEGQRGKIQISWDTAFSHMFLPYTEPAASLSARIPLPDRNAYPGLAASRALVERFRTSYGIHLLAYFSGHCLSDFDPMLVQSRPVWEVDPPFVLRAGHGSYPTPNAKPVLSHRAKSYSDYLLYRMDEEIDKLGLAGIYLDQASVMDSASPSHGAWVDFAGRPQASTDILGTRALLKRLRTLFHQKGKPGYVLAHASNNELIPAFTFATAIVDGEQFTRRLVSDDYIASLPLDQARLQMAPGQYGIRSMWIPQFSYFHASDPAWKGSAAEKRAYRNFLALTLVHDAEFVPQDIPAQDRLNVLAAFDGFGTPMSTFHGYWIDRPLARSPLSTVAISAYRRSSPTRLLLVVSNLSPSGNTVPIEIDAAAAGFPIGAGTQAWDRPSGTAIPWVGGRFSVPIPGKDFRLIEIR